MKCYIIIRVSVVYLRIYPVKGLRPGNKILKKGGTCVALGPKIQKKAKAPGAVIRKV